MNPTLCGIPSCPYCNTGPAPEPAATAEQTVADLLALVAVYEAKEPAFRHIPTRLIRELIEDGARRARNGRILEQSSEGYVRRAAASNAALRHHPRVES
jgi:hypothetical protein